MRSEKMDKSAGMEETLGRAGNGPAGAFCPFCYTRKGRTVAARRWGREQDQVKGCFYAMEMGNNCFQ